MTHAVLTALGLNDHRIRHLPRQWRVVRRPATPACSNRSTRPTARCWRGCTPPRRADYDTIVERAQAAFAVWRTTPAPRRGEAIRLCADALRKHKDALGSLVALEMGKSKPEGDGEVQEMIDIGDFAVGLSRQLYGLTMHSERPGHRMYEQWHPLGLVGDHHRLQLPGRGVGLECVPRRRSAATSRSGSPRPRPRCRRSPSMKICNEALQRRRLPGHLLPVQRRRHRAGLERSSTTSASR